MPQGQMPPPLCLFIKSLKPFHIGTKSRLPFLFQPVHALCHTGHQYIRWAACFVNIQITPDLLCRYPVTAPVQHCCLGQGRQCFMKAFDHQICPFLHSSFPSPHPVQMSAMSLVHYKGDLISVDYFCYFAHFRHYPFISRGSKDDASRIFMSF